MGDSGSKVELRQLYARSNLRGAATLLFDWLLIVGVFWLATSVDSWWLYPLVFACQSLLGFAVGESMLHEASHYNLFRTRALNNWVAPLVAWPVFTVLTSYRDEHIDHHRLTGTANDPVLEQYRSYGLDPDRPPSQGRLLWILLIQPLYGFTAARFIYDTLTGLEFRRLETWLMLAAWVAVTTLMWGSGLLVPFVLYWLLPVIFGFSTVLYWSEIADHYNVQTGHTRTDFSLLTKLCSHNAGYHALHHHRAAIPWFRLPAAYRQLRGTFAETHAHSVRELVHQLCAREIE